MNFELKINDMKTRKVLEAFFWICAVFGFGKFLAECFSLERNNEPVIVGVLIVVIMVAIISAFWDKDSGWKNAGNMFAFFCPAILGGFNMYPSWLVFSKDILEVTVMNLVIFIVFLLLYYVMEKINEKEDTKVWLQKSKSKIQLMKRSRC